MIPVKIQRADTESTKPTLENAHTLRTDIAGTKQKWEVESQLLGET